LLLAGILLLCGQGVAFGGVLPALLGDQSPVLGLLADGLGVVDRAGVGHGLLRCVARMD
jgi:hypothetical protein